MLIIPEISTVIADLSAYYTKQPCNPDYSIRTRYRIQVMKQPTCYITKSNDILDLTDTSRQTQEKISESPRILLFSPGYQVELRCG